MKSSLATNANGSSNRRQPVRSSRATANRPSNYYAKPTSYRHSTVTVADPEPQSSAPGFFPAVTFFTDALTALPKEMQKHFTMLKETEGKLHQPDQTVTDLVNDINKLPDPPRVPSLDRNQAYMQLSLANSISGSTTGSVVNGMTPRRIHLTSDVDTQAQRMLSQDPDPQREELFVQLITKLKEMIAILDEKNMILSASNDTLFRQLTRFDSAIPHIENEVSEDARLGSNTHWALPHMKDLRRTNSAPSDRGRRDVTNVNNLAAAAAAVHEGEIAATRSEARREAMLAKRNRARDPDSDIDDRAVSRKQVTNKARKGQETTSDPKAVGGSQPAKRRRVDKGGAGERAIGAALSGRLGGTRASPRGSPVPEGNRKRTKPLVAPTGSRKKATANPSSLASSPTRGTFPSNRNQSPARQQTSRARQSSAQVLVNEDTQSRRPSSTSSIKKANAASDGPPLVTGRLVQEDTVAEEKATGTEAATDLALVQSTSNGANGAAKRRESVKNERPDVTELKHVQKAEDAPSGPIGRHSRAASRSSKPTTPLSTTINEGVQMARQRSTRNGANTTQTTGSGPPSPRRSHKKGGNGTSAMVTESLGSSEEAEENKRPRRSRSREAVDAAGETAGEEIDENDENEPRYCTCNRVSFGNMIACDSASCPYEWFHLGCVDLDRAPSGRWFCSERCRKEASTRRGR